MTGALGGRGLPRTVPQVLAGPQRSRRRETRFWGRFWRHRPALVGVALLALLLLAALLADRLAPGDPFATSRDVLLPPSGAHPFGSDDLGRDLFRGVLHGARVSLLVGFVSVAVATALGVLVGGVAGYAGGLVDDGLMRIAELCQVIPRFFLVLVAVAVLGSRLWLIVLLLGLTLWPSTARLLRGQVLALRDREYVVAARAVGVRGPALLARHILPAALPPVVTQASLGVGGAILIEAGLSFLGLGDRSVVSWGALLNDAQQFVRPAPWLSLFPGLAITLTVLGMSLLADGLNEAWNPRLARR